MARKPSGSNGERSGTSGDGGDEELRKALGRWGDFLSNDAVKEITQRMSHPDLDVQRLVEVRSARFEPPPERKPLEHLAAKEREIASITQPGPTAQLEPPDGTKSTPAHESQTAQSSVQNDEVERGKTARPRSSSEAVIKAAIFGEYVYSCIALILGLSSIIGGSILCIYGVTGHTSFTANLLGLNANLNDAAPGVVLFVIGLFMIWATRPKVKLGDLVG